MVCHRHILVGQITEHTVEFQFCHIRKVSTALPIGAEIAIVAGQSLQLEIAAVSPDFGDMN